ncbi:MAG: alpha/beta hydrolase, partial [Syntrophomonas sp.]|nr:alpha/beta hydrolase [Syntrophomonas sp.]
GEIKSPVLIVSNSRDIDFVHEIEDYIQEKLTNSIKIVMEDCCHLPYVEKPEEFNQIVLDFLQGVAE